jgi:hypothetical protein
MGQYDAEIDALRQAIAAGVRRVVTQTNGVRKEVEYPSFADMKARYDWLCRLNGGGGRNVTLASF